jgi:hypothetical protein
VRAVDGLWADAVVHELTALRYGLPYGGDAAQGGGARARSARAGLQPGRRPPRHLAGGLHRHGPALGTPPPRRIPRWLFRLAAPYVASFAVDTSMRVANAKAKTELGRQPTFPTYHDGIRAMAAAARS